MKTLICLLAMLAPPLCASQAFTQPFFVWVQSQSQPQPAPQAACPSRQVSKPKNEQARKMALAAAIQAREENDRINMVIQVERIRKWQAAQTVDPEKDDYRKYLAYRQAKAETFDDPDAPAMQAWYNEQDEQSGRTRNDYKKWIENRRKKDAIDEFAEWLKNNPQPEQKAAINIEKFGEDIQKALSNQEPEKKAKPKKSEQKDMNE